MPPTKLGHFHLYVATWTRPPLLPYLLGFDDMGYARDFRMGMVSAGRYHHHIGYNTWVGEGAPPPPAGALGLRHIAFGLPSAAELARVVAHAEALGVATSPHPLGVAVQDPSRNTVSCRHHQPVRAPSRAAGAISLAAHGLRLAARNVDEHFAAQPPPSVAF
jgi:catechol 2,3-dioxygenase